MQNTLVQEPASRPETVARVLGSLDRYNPQNIGVCQDYVNAQAASRTNDIAANLALLKLYQFNPFEAKDDVIVKILAKALVRFYAADFTSCLHLLPPSVTTVAEPTPDSLADQTQRLFALYRQLDGAKYSEFWATYEQDDYYADLVSDVQGFEDDIRLAIAQTVGSAFKRIGVSVLKDWLNLASETKFSEFVTHELGWTIDGDVVVVPLNRDNDIKPIVTTESVRLGQLDRLIRRAYEKT